MIIFCLLAVTIAAILLSSIDVSQDAEIFLDKSGPYLGADYAKEQGYTGKGIVIAVIDTGVDFSHPDLYGFAHDQKVIGGHNFVDAGAPPDDDNGHGTQVAGIIAADGNITGIAPKSKILSYKVSGNGQSVSSDLIINAINEAIIDGADIINISLGVNKTNSRIDAAVNDAIDDGIVVVVAAGNDGPQKNTIGSPGRNQNAITVGATYNNITSSLVSTLTINEKQYQVIPMLGVRPISEPVNSVIIDAKYAREYDFDSINAIDAILLVERGSDKEDEMVYFTYKESNAANAGAVAIIVYNNQPDLYLGDVSKSFTDDNYTPTIPIVSLSQKDGLEIKKMLDSKLTGTLDVFYNADHVAFFSSRGPVSPFYIKPDMVAPGAFVNSTDLGGTYDFSSGTSVSTPHVAGAAALLLEKHPKLQPAQVKSILVTTTVAATDAYGANFAVADAGRGRLDIENALKAEMIIEPTFVIMTFSPIQKEQTHKISLDGINGNMIKDITVELETPDIIDASYGFKNGTLEVYAKISDILDENHEGSVVIGHGDATYRIPIIFQYTRGDITANEEKGLISFDINEPKDWRYAKISAVNKKTSEFFTTSITPKHDSEIRVTDLGEYWIEGVINVGNQTYYAYDEIHIQTENTNLFSKIKISEKPIYIIIAIAAITAIAGIRFKRNNQKDQDLGPASTI